MSTIVIDEQPGAMPLRDVIRQASDDLIELRQSTGELIGMLIISPTPSNYPSEDDYAAAIARAEADMCEIRRRMAHPSSECLTLEQLMAGLNSAEL